MNDIDKTPEWLRNLTAGAWLAAKDDDERATVRGLYHEALDRFLTRRQVDGDAVRIMETMSKRTRKECLPA